MEENQDESNKKPLNIVLLGDDSSEKEKLMSKFLLLNSPQFQENETKNEEDKEEDISIFQNIIHCVEMHGEKLQMKLWDNPSTEEFLSPSIKIAQGILLFYSVKNRKSYEKIKNDLSKIIELGRFDIPIIVIGNHKTSQEREVSYEEAKTWADNYGLRFYETSLENDGSIKEILQDIGEQLLFQECILSANNSVIINEEEKDDLLNLEENLNIGSLIESKNKESAKKEKENENKTISYIDKEDVINKNYSSNNLLDSNNNKKKKSNNKNSKNILSKNNSSSFFKKIKPKLKSNTNPNNKTKTENRHMTKSNSTIFTTENNTHNKINSNVNNTNANKISNFLNFSKINIINKTKNLFKKNPDSNNLNKTSYGFHSKKNSVNSLNLSSSNTNVHSYLKKTALTKNREKEIKEKKIKIEKESQTITAQKEREGLELKKKKNLENKENYLKKIKEDKILQKEKEKKKKEEEIKNAKNNYDKIKQEKELITQEKKIEKEKDKLNKIALKQSEKEKLNKRVEEINKEREKEIENIKNKKEKEKEKTKEKNNNSPNKFRKESSSTYNINTNSKSKSENINNIIRSRKASIRMTKDKEINKEREKELNEKIISVKIDKEKDKENNEIKDIIKTKENLKNNFLKKQSEEDIYRCLKCNSIPKILFNENNQEIEVICDHSKLKNSNHHNIISYQNFQTKSLDHSLYENTFCYFCNKSLNKLEPNDMLYYCPLCQFWFCSKDEAVHNKLKHQNEIDIKNKYKLITKSQKITNVKRRGSIELDLNKKANSSNYNNTMKRLSFKINSGSLKIDSKKSESNKSQENKNDNITQKELIKIPIYLLDTFCSLHDQIYNSYCYSCNKNICQKCINDIHINHNIENLENIIPKEDEINKKKLELDIIKENLKKINEYFIALIEAIKCRFERLYKAKQKEIEIKEKIIRDFEKIKYNYNSIINFKNLNLDNKQNFINTKTNLNWIESLNLIFEYLNCSITSEKNTLFKDMNKNKFTIANIYFNNEEIKNIIKLNNNNNNKDLALINNKSELKIYSLKNNNLIEKIKLKIFPEEDGINHIIQLNNGNLACCGYENINLINYDIFNHNAKITNIINEKYNNFLFLIEITNNYLISSDTSKKIRIWNKNKNNIYKCLNHLDDEIEINLLYNIDYQSFIGCSYNDKKIIKYCVSKNKEIISEFKLNNISIIKGNNSLVKYDSDYLLLNYKENNKYGIIIIRIDKFEIMSKISNVVPIYYINKYLNEKIIIIDKYGFIKKYNFSKKNCRLYECDKIKIYNNSFSEDNLRSFYEISNNIIIFQYKNKIALYYKNG